MSEDHDASAPGHRLQLPRCTACGRFHWYPRPFCPFCGATDLEWLDASGRGSVYSASTMWQASPVYTIAYVTLEEGPTMLTQIVDCAHEDVRIGMPVQLRFGPTAFSETAVPLFGPAGAAAAPDP